MTGNDRRFLVFSLPGSLYAVDLAQVAEVGDPPALWPIPLAPPCYSGAMNFHGDIVAAMDLALFLGLPGPGRAGKIVMLRQEIASLAFLVDAIVRIVSEAETSITPAQDSLFAAATLKLPEGEATLLDLEALVSAAEMGMQKRR